MKNGHAIFFSELKTLIHKIICVKNNYYPATIKNDNGDDAMRFFCATQT